MNEGSVGNEPGIDSPADAIHRRERHLGAVADPPPHPVTKRNTSRNTAENDGRTRHVALDDPLRAPEPVLATGLVLAALIAAGIYGYAVKGARPAPVNAGPG